MSFLLSVSENITVVTDWLTANWAIVLAWVGVPATAMTLIVKIVSIINNVIGLKKAKTFSTAISDVKGTIVDTMSSMKTELASHMDETISLANKTKIKAKKEILGIVDDVKEQAIETVNELKTTVDEVKDVVSDNIDSSKQVITDVIATAKENAGTVIKTVRRVVKRR